MSLLNKILASEIEAVFQVIEPDLNDFFKKLEGILSEYEPHIAETAVHQLKHICGAIVQYLEHKVQGQPPLTERNSLPEDH